MSAENGKWLYGMIWLKRPPTYWENYFWRKWCAAEKRLRSILASNSEDWIPLNEVLEKHGYTDPVCECGAKIVGHFAACEPCRNAKNKAERAERQVKEAAEENARFAKAKKITVGDYGACFVYDPSERFNGGFHPDVDDLAECYTDAIADDDEVDDDGEPIAVLEPRYVWACHEVRPSIDAESIIEDLENQCVDADFDYECNGDKEALQAFLDGWLAELSPWYEPDYSTAIVLDEMLLQAQPQEVVGEHI